MFEPGKVIGHVMESTPSQIRVDITDVESFETNKAHLAIGQYLLVASGNNLYMLSTIVSIKATNTIVEGQEETKFAVDVQPIGTWSDDGQFQRGAQSLPVPTEPAYVVDPEVLKTIFVSQVQAPFSFARLSVNRQVPFHINGDLFFSKHIAITGSTGSGKSCAVASILQKVLGFHQKRNIHKDGQKNSHIVILDIHAEYEAAFRLHDEENFSLNLLDVDKLMLPYWLMNAQELEEMFVESNEINSHNQISQFRFAVAANKRRHNPTIVNISFDTPIFFSIDEVVTYLENMNLEVIGKLSNEGKPKLENGTLIDSREEYYFSAVQVFVPSSTAGASRAGNGPFHGEFDRLILRLKSRLSDPRLKFLFYPSHVSGANLHTDDFADVVRQFVGYLTKSNVSIVDLSGIPFEVLSIVVSLISRLIFDFGFHYSKIRHGSGLVSDVPVMLVCEEAHNYVPRVGGAEYNASRKSIERIAKEGRKYGVTLMVVSQRPSEVSDTIFSQCSNFISLRLTNYADQNYVKALLPDLSSGLGDILPNLAQGEFLAVGDATLMPTIGHFDMPVPEPHSRSVDYLTEWNADWKAIDFGDVIDRWRGKTLTLNKS